MAFGIGGGLFFGYLPFIRINGMPLVTYRAAAGHILRQIAAIPGVTMYRKKFRNRDEAMAELDRALASSIPVFSGCPTFRRPCVFTSMPTILWCMGRRAMST